MRGSNYDVYLQRMVHFSATALIEKKKLKREKKKHVVEILYCQELNCVSFPAHSDPQDDSEHQPSQTE